MIRLRDYQDVSVNEVRSGFAARFIAILLVLATGGGKTVCFAFVALGAAAKGKRVLIVAHRRELIKQASRKLAEAGVPHGIIAPGHTPTRDLVQVGSIQTLARRLDKLPRFDLIIPDEAHHAVAGQWAKLIEAQPQAKLLGVTATPERLDGRGLGRDHGGCFDHMVLGPSPAELTAWGFLTPARIFAPAEAPDLSGIRTKGGDFDADQLEQQMNVATITGDVLQHWKRLAPGLPTIAFCISVQHAQDVAETFRTAGIRAVCGHGGMLASERDAAIGGLATGAVQVLTTCDLVSEGLDVPVVGAVILLRPTKSLGLYLQQIGRGLRPVYAAGFDLEAQEGRLAAIEASGKRHLIVLDHAGCTAIHGLSDEARAWSLAGRPKGVKPPATWQCSACFAMQRPAPKCVACDYVEPVEAKPSEGRKLVHADGELVEVDRARIEKLRAGKLGDILTGRETKEQLQEIAKARGFHPYWVIRVLKERRERRAGHVHQGRAA